MNPENVVARRSVSFETATVWAIALTAAIATLVLVPSASIPFLYTKVSVLALGAIVVLALFILARLTRGNAVLPPLPLVLAMWAVPLAYLLSGIFSGTTLSAALFGSQLEPDTLGFVIIMAALGTLSALAVRRVDQYRTFLKLMGGLFALVVALQVLILIIGEIAPGFLSPATALPGSFSDLSMLVGLGLIGAMLALRFLPLEARVKKALYVACGLGLVLLAVANSFFVWSLVALAALGLFVEAVMRRTPFRGEEGESFPGTTLLAEQDAEGGEESGSRMLGASLAVLVVSLFFLIGGSTIGGALGNALGLNLLDVRPSWQSTVATGSHVYASSPLFGSGPGTFGAEWLKSRDASLNSTIFWNIDFTTGIGYLPTSFVTTGIAGAVAWLLLLGLFVFLGFRFLLFRASNDPVVRFVSLLSFVAAAYVFVTAVVDVPGPVVLAFGFISLGVFASTLRFGKGQSQHGIVFGRSPRIGFVIVFALTLLLLASIVAAYAVVERYLAQVALTRAVSALSAGNIDGAGAAVAQALVFSQSDDAYRLESQIAQARLNQIAGDTGLSADAARTGIQAALTDGIQAALTATKLAPNRYQNWVALGTMYGTVVPLGVPGAYDNAKAAYAKAQELNPSSPQLPYILAQLEIANKDNKAAEAFLVQAIQLKQDFTQAIFLLSQLEVASGNAQGALAAAESAAYFAPNDPAVLFQVGILRAGTGDLPGAIAALSKAASVNPQFANARYFLAVAYAESKDFANALGELEAVAALSPDNEKAVASYIAALRKGTNPFPSLRTGAVGTLPESSPDASTK
ncbi:MAG: tetratricopeptide repeat protein [bacterium]